MLNIRDVGLTAPDEDPEIVLGEAPLPTSLGEMPSERDRVCHGQLREQRELRGPKGHPRGSREDRKGGHLWN